MLTLNQLVVAGDGVPGPVQGGLRTGQPLSRSGQGR